MPSAISSPPSWLPGFIRLDTNVHLSLDDYYKDTFKQFEKDWNHKSVRFKGLSVYYDMRISNWNLPEGFWHITSQNSLNTGDRLPDLLRCERILWIATMIQAFSEQNPVIKQSIQTTKNRRKRSIIRNHLFLDIPDYCHLVILQKSVSAYHLVSSFHIGEGSKKCRYYRALAHVP